MRWALLAVISVQAKLTTEDLLAALEQLEPAEAEKVARRLEALAELAHLPHVSLPALMKQLGLKADPVA